MRSTAVAAASMALGALSINVAHARSLNAGDWCRRIEALVQSFVGREPGDGDVIAPSGNVDSGMAIIPPRQGIMRMIVPPTRGERS